MSNDLNKHVIRVFVDDKNKFGNPVGVVLDEDKKITAQDRQQMATELGYSESVFINSLKSGNVSIFNPREEVSFAGHALVGTAWLINKISRTPFDSLACAGGLVPTWQAAGCTWIRAGLAMLPPWQYEQRQNSAEVDRLTSAEASSKTHTFIWAWLDESRGLVRARTFAPDWGIPEDEANGSGSMTLAAALGRSLEIRHGRGSIIYAKPWGSDFVDLGGRAAEDRPTQPARRK